MGPGEYFVTIDNGEFVVGCQRFMLAGWNQWEVVEAAAGAPFLSGAAIPVNLTGPEVRTVVRGGIVSRPPHGASSCSPCMCCSLLAGVLDKARDGWVSVGRGGLGLPASGARGSLTPPRLFQLCTSAQGPK